MHGLINCSMQGFVRDSYGQRIWDKVVDEAGLDFKNFEAMLHYPDEQTEMVLCASCKVLGKQRDDLLGDLGLYLVSHENTQSLRRLLRFGGATYVEFLHSLNDLHERVRMAIPDMVLPPITVAQKSNDDYSLKVAAGLPGFGMVLAGLLRAMGDDYGALVFPDGRDTGQGSAEIDISVLDVSFAEGRQFDLAVAGAE